MFRSLLVEVPGSVSEDNPVLLIILRIKLKCFHMLLSLGHPFLGLLQPLLPKLFFSLEFLLLCKDLRPLSFHKDLSFSIVRYWLKIVVRELLWNLNRFGYATIHVGLGRSLLGLLHHSGGSLVLEHGTGRFSGVLGGVGGCLVVDGKLALVHEPQVL